MVGSTTQSKPGHAIDPASVKAPQLRLAALKCLLATGLNIGIFFCSKGLFRSISSLVARLLACIILFSPTMYFFLNSLTEFLEGRRRRCCNLDAWDMLEKDIYGSAKIFEVRPGRRICVAEVNKGGSANGSTTILFVHGSMARLSQFAEQLTYFSSRGYRVVIFVAIKYTNELQF